MLRKRAAHQKKVDSAVRVLQTTTGVSVPMAMILAGFSKSDIADKIVHQQVRRRMSLMGVTDNNQREVIFVDVDNTPSLSDFTSDNDALLPTTLESSSSSAPTNPKPKKKQIRPTASAVQQHRVDNLAAKKHKSDARIRRPSAYLTPRRRSQMACPSGRFTMSSHRSMKPAPVLRQSAATLPMGL